MERALLIIDMLEDFISEDGVLYVGEQGREIIKPIDSLIEAERDNGSEIIYVCDSHFRNDAKFEMFPPHCVKGSGGANIIPELQSLERGTIVEKRRFSAFAGTDLDITLREQEIGGVILTGVCSNICVLYTPADARSLNHSVKVYEDCVTSFDLQAHEFALKEMKDTLGASVL